MDSRMVGRELISVARELVGMDRRAGEGIEDAIRNVDGARDILKALSVRLSESSQNLDMAREIKFLDRTDEQLTMLSINLEGLKRRLR